MGRGVEVTVGASVVVGSTGAVPPHCTQKNAMATAKASKPIRLITFLFMKFHILSQHLRPL
jgi:hypothetical protein